MRILRALSLCVVALACAVLGAGARAENGVTDDTIVIGSHGPLTGVASFVGLGSVNRFSPMWEYRARLLRSIVLSTSNYMSRFPTGERCEPQ